jgi:hypothetical protein
MAPGFAESPSWRALAGAAIPVLLAALITPDGIPALSVDAAARSPPKAAFRAPPGPIASAVMTYQEGDDLRTFVERARPHLDDPRTMYSVSQALEECHAWGTTPDEGETYPSVSVVSHVDLLQWKRMWASEALAAPCRGFDGRAIDSREILALLQEAARQGEPHARARMLAFRDIAAPKADTMAEIPALLATGDPHVVRDVGAFLTRGEVALRYGGEDVDASSAAIAWELAACDMGYPCGPMSRLVLTACAFRGYCDEYRYDEAIAREEAPERMALAQRLRGSLVNALRKQDWSWLGLATVTGAAS